jgi:hypothetical protein
MNDAARSESQYRSILMSTVGIVFLATPLRGTRLASAVSWYLYGRGRVGFQVSDTLTKDLQENTGVLNELVRIFAENVHSSWLQLPGHCFFERQNSRPFKAIVGGWARKLPNFTTQLVGSISITYILAIADVTRSFQRKMLAYMGLNEMDWMCHMS